MNAQAIAVAIPIFFALVGLEYVVARRTKRHVARLPDSIASLSCGVVQQASAPFLAIAVLGAYAWIHERHALFAIDERSFAAWLALFLGVDLAYYFFHRASHRVNAIWATHVVHHQSEEYNLTTALRQSALQGAASAVFYWPLALVGFPPTMFVAMVTANTLYQFWIHTRLVGKLGSLELFFNTPSHHRVHHGIDPAYVDKNYGGILIVWDRLFGTFADETVEPAYGTVKPLSSWHPLWANVDSWAHLARVASRARRWRDKVWIWFAPPEWMPADLGGSIAIPEVDHASRALYTTPRDASLGLYVNAHFALVGLATAYLLVGMEGAGWLALAGLAAWITISTSCWSGLFERRAWARSLEALRLAALPLLAAWLLPGAWAIAVSSLVALASLAWLARHRHLALTQKAVAP